MKTETQAELRSAEEENVLLRRQLAEALEGQAGARAAFGGAEAELAQVKTALVDCGFSVEGSGSLAGCIRTLFEDEQREAGAYESLRAESEQVKTRNEALVWDRDGCAAERDALQQQLAAAQAWGQRLRDEAERLRTYLPRELRANDRIGDYPGLPPLLSGLFAALGAPSDDTAALDKVVGRRVAKLTRRLADIEREHRVVLDNILSLWGRKKLRPGGMPTCPDCYGRNPPDGDRCAAHWLLAKARAEPTTEEPSDG